MSHTGGAREMPAWITELSMLATERERLALIRKQSNVRTTETVERLYDAVVALMRIDLQRAERLAQAATWIAADLEDERSRAMSARALGNVYTLGGKHAEAVTQYIRAISAFERLGAELEVAITITSGTLQCLSYEGQYQRAFDL